MIIVVILIAVSLIIALIFLGVFFWNIKTGQYDDMITPAVRILFEDQDSPADQKKSTPTESAPPKKVATYDAKGAHSIL